MRVNFLADADQTRLSKTFTPNECHPYPNVARFQSFHHDIETLPEFFDLLQEHAQQGHCLLKGELTRPLNNERRANATNSISPTSYIVLDLDFADGFDSIEHFLRALGLQSISYIVHHSASSGIRCTPGLRSHIFILLKKPVTPPLLKLWLQNKNLTIPELKSLTSLAANGYALRWPLDTTTCQNDKLIYIADPTCIDLEDPMAGKRFAIHIREQDAWDFSYSADDFAENTALTQAAIESKRDALGLPKRKAKFTTSGEIEYLRNPAQAIVTGERTARGFVYLNLNGGDSWAYYYPENQPEYLFNFKGEPVVRLRDIAPEYYASVRQTITPTTAEILTDEQGVLRWIFRDNRTDSYYTAICTDTDLTVAPTSRRGALDWMLANDPNGVEPEIIPEWTIEFDPTRLEIIDIPNRWINSFRPTQYMTTAYDPVHEVPPTCAKIIRSICVEQDMYEYFLDWLAWKFQYRTPCNTAIIFRGTTGTGKGTLFHQILCPLFGKAHCRQITMDVFKENFNGYIEQALFINIDEATINDKESDRLIAKANNMITEPTIALRRMRKDAYEVKRYCDIVITTNNRAPIKLPEEDRRWNTAASQEQSLREQGFDIESISLIPDELDQLAAFLQHRAVDYARVNRPLENEARRQLFEATETTLERFFRALKEGDLDYFCERWFDEEEHAPNPITLGYERVLKDLFKVYNEGKVFLTVQQARALYQFIMETAITPEKFGRISSYRLYKTERVRVNSVLCRGWHIKFHLKDEGWVKLVLAKQQEKPNLKLVKNA